MDRINQSIKRLDFKITLLSHFREVSWSLEFSARLAAIERLKDLWDEVFDTRNIGFPGCYHKDCLFVQMFILWSFFYDHLFVPTINWLIDWFIYYVVGFFPSAMQYCMKALFLQKLLHAGEIRATNRRHHGTSSRNARRHCWGKTRARQWSAMRTPVTFTLPPPVQNPSSAQHVGSFSSSFRFISFRCRVFIIRTIPVSLAAFFFVDPCDRKTSGRHSSVVS